MNSKNRKWEKIPTMFNTPKILKFTKLKDEIESEIFLKEWCLSELTSRFFDMPTSLEVIICRPYERVQSHHCTELNIVHSNPRCQECEVKSRPRSPMANSGTGSMHTKAGRYQAQTITLENRNTLVKYGNMIMLTK